MIAARIVGKKNLHAGAPSCTGFSVARISGRCGTVDTALRRTPIICVRQFPGSAVIFRCRTNGAHKSQRDKQASTK
jgi:hypothetical protein